MTLVWILIGLFAGLLLGVYVVGARQEWFKDQVKTVSEVGFDSLVRGSEAKDQNEKMMYYDIVNDQKAAYKMMMRGEMPPIKHVAPAYPRNLLESELIDPDSLTLGELIKYYAHDRKHPPKQAKPAKVESNVIHANFGNKKTAD